METQLEKLMKRIPYDEETYSSKEEYLTYLEALLEDTEDIAINHLFPFEIEKPKLPTRYYGWQLRACEEIDAIAGLNGLKSYSENGLSYTKATDGILSSDLLSELVPYAAAPQKSLKENADDKG